MLFFCKKAAKTFLNLGLGLGAADATGLGLGKFLRRFFQKAALLTCITRPCAPDCGRVGFGL
jgi:hypothetical protein